MKRSSDRRITVLSSDKVRFNDAGRSSVTLRTVLGRVAATNLHMGVTHCHLLGDRNRGGAALQLQDPRRRIVAQQPQLVDVVVVVSARDSVYVV